MMMNKNSIAICGPTASGKTKLAVEIARLTNGEIISADSRQVYRGMDIGTGKDLCEYGERGADDFVPYHLIDIVDPSQIYTLYDYQRDFYKTFDDVTTRGHLPIISGGSGLYIEAVIKGYNIPPVPENVDFRKSMMKEDRETLIKMLDDENPQLLARTDTSTKKRIVRALEVAKFGGANAIRAGASPAPTSHHHRTITPMVGAALAAALDGTNNTNANFPKINPLILYIIYERSELRNRIEQRLHERLNSGLVEEVSQLINSGIPRGRFALFGMEYKHAARYIDGEVSYDNMVSQLLQDIFHLAKRQDTWFRGMERRGLKTHPILRGSRGDAMEIIAAARMEPKTGPQA
jgi:tRNA dimethylallyltransferase